MIRPAARAPLTSVVGQSRTQRHPGPARPDLTRPLPVGFKSSRVLIRRSRGPAEHSRRRTEGNEHQGRIDAESGAAAYPRGSALPHRLAGLISPKALEKREKAVQARLDDEAQDSRLGRSWVPDHGA